MSSTFNPYSTSQWLAANQSPWNQVGPPSWEQGGVTNPQTQGVIAPAPTQPFAPSNYLAGGTSNQIPGFNPLTPGGGFYPMQPATPPPAPAPAAPAVGGFGFQNPWTEWTSGLGGPVRPVPIYDRYGQQRGAMNQFAQQSTQPQAQPGAPVPPGMAADQALAQQGGAAPAGPNPFFGFGFPAGASIGYSPMR